MVNINTDKNFVPDQNYKGHDKNKCYKTDKNKFTNEKIYVRMNEEFMKNNVKKML